MASRKINAQGGREGEYKIDMRKSDKDDGKRLRARVVHLSVFCVFQKVTQNEATKLLNLIPNLDLRQALAIILSDVQ